MNHLKDEKSPYLIQHINNPVDWYPWGEEAFNKAKEEDKPVFMSIGYSTCHWCHVMAHESFEDAEVAEILNEHYVSVKVDREERPDIDAVYMAVCQGLTGSGGWPLTIIMIPDRKPFFAATYLPKNSRYGMTGLIELLESVNEQWKTNRPKLLSTGEDITAFFKKQEHVDPVAGEPSKELIDKAYKIFSQSFDRRFGGFGGAPKFPSPHNLLFLMRYSIMEKNTGALDMAERTLKQMYRGGMFDHIGGGFSRYATDEQWLVPHFEKMLYDNALLGYAYTEAYKVTSNDFYRGVAKKTLDYVLRELTDGQGGFYCGQDADSDGVEGKYYVFTKDEIKTVLGEAEGELFCQWFGITERENFENGSIPNLITNPEYTSQNARTDELCGKLYEYRLSRTRLHKDDKILTSWNALMIAALAKAGRIFNEPRYIMSAAKAQQFIKENLTDSQGGLMVRWREGEAANTGNLDDYAFYAFALLELYESTFDAAFLMASIDTADRILAKFGDGDKGGFFLYPSDGEQLINRPKEFYDGAMPSGNSAAAMVFAKLSKLTGDVKWQNESDKQLSFMAGVISGYPAGNSFSLLAFMEALYPSKELICTASENKIIAVLQAFLNDKTIPNLTVLCKTPQNEKALSEKIPLVGKYPVPEDGAYYYLCQNGTCLAPVRNLEDLERQLLK